MGALVRYMYSKVIDGRILIKGGGLIQVPFQLLRLGVACGCANHTHFNIRKFSFIGIIHLIDAEELNVGY